jgi:hypothetical protein
MGNIRTDPFPDFCDGRTDPIEGVVVDIPVVIGNKSNVIKTVQRQLNSRLPIGQVIIFRSRGPPHDCGVCLLILGSNLFISLLDRDICQNPAPGGFLFRSSKLFKDRLINFIRQLGFFAVLGILLNSTSPLLMYRIQFFIAHPQNSTHWRKIASRSLFARISLPFSHDHNGSSVSIISLRNQL